MRAGGDVREPTTFAGRLSAAGRSLHRDADRPPRYLANLMTLLTHAMTTVHSGGPSWLWLLLGLALGTAVAAAACAVRLRRTERRSLALLQRAQADRRLAELGTLAGGLAHEIKNPLSSVNLNCQLLQEDLRHLARGLPADQSESHDQIQRMQRRFESLARETARLKDILDDFLRFAGRVKLHCEEHDINALIDELADFFAPQAQSDGVRIRTQLSANPARLSVDQALLKQAMLNLMINATRAMADARRQREPHGGADELILRTQRTRSLGQDQLQIHVTDTGPGIEPDKIEKIFEPYFTGRNGTGLGLPTARRIVEEHGGTLTVHTELGRGSDFVITLPTPGSTPAPGS